jgi:FkbM family methyltransferase
MSAFQFARAILKKSLPSNLYFTIRSAYYRASNSIYRARKISFKCMDHQFQIAIKDQVAEEWYGSAAKSGHLPPAAEILWIQKLIEAASTPPELVAKFNSKSCTIFDLGAHQGVVAMILEKLFATHGKVVALEAGSHNHSVLCENLDLNQSKGIIPLYRAAGKKPGQIEFDDSMNGEVSASKMPALSKTVEVGTIDLLADEFGIPDLVLVDVEGFEKPVLEGGLKTIRSGNTMFVIEIHHEHQRARYGSDLAGIRGLFPDSSRFYMGLPETGDFSPLQGSSWLEKKDKFFLIVVPG